MKELDELLKDLIPKKRFLIFPDAPVPKRKPTKLETKRFLKTKKKRRISRESRRKNRKKAKA